MEFRFSYNNNKYTLKIHTTKSIYILYLSVTNYNYDYITIIISPYKTHRNHSLLLRLEYCKGIIYKQKKKNNKYV